MSTDTKPLLDTASFLSTGWSQEIKLTFNTRDAILYALGVGAEEPEFVYECDENFAVLPTLPFALCFRGDANDVLPFPPAASSALGPLPPNVGLKALDYRRRIELFRPLPHPGAAGVCCALQGRPRSVLVRKAGVVVEYETTMSIVDHQDGQESSSLICRMHSATFLLGARATESAGNMMLTTPVAFPSFPPDFSTEQILHPSYVK